MKTFCAQTEPNKVVGVLIFHEFTVNVKSEKPSLGFY